MTGIAFNPTMDLFDISPTFSSADGVTQIDNALRGRILNTHKTQWDVIVNNSFASSVDFRAHNDPNKAPGWVTLTGSDLIVNINYGHPLTNVSVNSRELIAAHEVSHRFRGADYGGVGNYFSENSAALSKAQNDLLALGISQNIIDAGINSAILELLTQHYEERLAQFFQIPSNRPMGPDTLEDLIKIKVGGSRTALPSFNLDNVSTVTVVDDTSECFLAGTMIEMADGSRKPIEDIRPEDQVMSFDEDGNKVAGRVTRTMTNESKIILDFHGTFVTPGHVYYCAGGKFEGGFAPLIDILRDDGVVQHEDNTLIRAATGCVVGSELDAEIWVLGIEADANGVYHEKIRKKLRLGTRFIIPDGSSISIAEDLRKIGMRARADGFVEHVVTGQKALYQWPVGGQMPPNPEDYVLQRSGTTLEDIYRAGEWEGQRPQMPPPMIRDGGEITPVSERTLMAMPRNVPMAMREGTPPDASPKLNRKARKAMEAKRRKAAKQTRGSQTLH